MKHMQVEENNLFINDSIYGNHEFLNLSEFN